MPLINNKISINGMLSESELKDILRDVEGQISPSEMYFLYQLSQEISNDSVIVEIGAYRGKSTLCLALGSFNGNKSQIYSIDPHEFFTGVMGGKFGPDDVQALYENLAQFPVGNLVFVICLTSKQVAPTWNKNIGLLWIDGDHKHQSVVDDFRGFKPFLKNTSLIAFHDNNYDGVKGAIDLLSENEIAVISTCHTITLARLKN